jgi:hypothetical protein
MTQLLRLVFRFFSITVAFFLACVTAALVYAFLSGLIKMQDFAIYSEVETYLALSLNVAILSTEFAQISFVPAYLCIIAFEIKQVRDWLIYLMTGGAISLLAPFIQSNPEFILPKTAYLVASAMAGGLIYWLFCGQRAGHWHRPPASK